MTAIVVMGVSGAGKTTVGQALAERLGVPYAEADDFHSPGNIAKMASGEPLTDADRAPWLESLAGWISEHPDGVVTSSALKRAYRDVLRTGGPVWFLHLDGTFELFSARVAGRKNHFMPASLLHSQLATLEPLQPDEHGVVVSAARPADVIVEVALQTFRFTRNTLH